jgi:hypothetical protein
VAAGIAQQCNDVLVRHLDSLETGFHNLGFADVPRHEDSSIQSVSVAPPSYVV